MNLQTAYTKALTAVAFLRNLDWKSKKTRAIAGILGLVVVGGVIAFSVGIGKKEPTQTVSLRSVELIDVSSYSKLGSAVLTGEGEREVVVRAEVGGKVARVVAHDTRVSLGQIVAELENASQRAALLQAEGALDAANASLSKIKRGSRGEQQSILGTNVSSAQSSLSATQEAAVTTLSSAYSAVDEAVRRKSDQMFSSPDTGSPKLTISTAESQFAVQAESSRVAIGAILSRQSLKASTIGVSDNLDAELKTTEQELRSVRSFLDTLTSVLNKAIPTSGVSSSDIAGYRADISAARSAISASISSVTASKEALASRAAGLDIAKKSLEQGVVADDADVLSASASVKQAQGAYASALAAYQKTIIRAPLSGTVTSCSPGIGDVINVGSDVCRIAGVGGVAGSSFALPLSSVKYTPGGAYVFVVNDQSALEVRQIETGLVSANSIIVSGLIGDEKIVKDVRGLREGEKVEILPTL